MENEFPRPVDINRLPGETVHEIEARPSEREALARRFGLLGVERLAAEVRLVPIRDGVRLEARFEADVVQECVVTLEPVRNRVADRFELVYGGAGAAGDPETIAEPLDGETIDIGEAVAQQLSLSLDPYPRAEGARLDPAWTGAPVAEHPFAALTRLKKPDADT